MKLFIGNLPREYSEEELKQLLSEFGTPTEVKIIKDRDTGQSRGFGFVTMGSSAEAEAAVEGLDGKEVGGRAIVVNKAREQQRSGSGGGGRRPPSHRGGF